MLVDIAEGSRLWGYSRFVLGRFGVGSVAGLRFARVLGSGHDGGFGLRPSATRQGLFCVFEDDQTASDFLAGHDLVRRYRAHAREFFSVRLHSYSCKGSWSGVNLPAVTAAPTSGPIAALTRASIKPARAAAFWRKAPPAQVDLEHAEGCLLAAGLGEAPLLRQATFSVWCDVGDMDRYARSGAHLEAIKAAHRHGFFSESMFARFVPVDMRGTYKGRAYG
ncbi:MAG: spheroidene monooxygenase [Rhodocyclaceae bacterium]|nr:spheroidene monooxygenase [Rhodocyclaceae bacterium]